MSADRAGPTRQSRRPSPALLIAVIALVAAVSGSAVALPGKNTIDKNDIKNGAVTKKAIKKGAVTAKAIKKGAVTDPALATGVVTPTKLAPHEAAHIVGAPGEPAFGTGGDGDCIWQNAPASSGITGLAPVGFFKDQLGNVRLQGLAIPEDGPGGDGDCNSAVPGEFADGVVFTLPAGYAPSTVAIRGSLASLLFVIPATGATSNGQALPPSAVFSVNNGFFDGVTFAPAPAP